MPDPTLTRYDVAEPECQECGGQMAEMSGGYFYRCEEADRLIQALREELEDERAEHLRAMEALAAHATQYENDREYNAELCRELQETVKYLRAALISERKSYEALTAEVGALRRALDAAQPIDYAARIRLRLSQAESCSHQLCSMADEVAEHREAEAMRRLLCAHQTWKRFNGTHWIISPFIASEPGAYYCAVCGAADYELTEAERVAAARPQAP